MKIFDLKKYKETYLKPTIINLLKTKDNEKVFKAERRDILVLVEKIQITANISSETVESGRSWHIFQVLGGKSNCQPQIPNLATKFFRNGEIQIFQTKKN